MKQLSWRVSVSFAAVCLLTWPLGAQSVARPSRTNALHDLNAAIESLTAAVAPSVVQVLVSGFRPVDGAGRGDAGLILGRQRSMGSGVIIDTDGYIVTNAHVVSGAQQVRVVLRGAGSPTDPFQSLTAEYETTVPATILGVAKDIDLALLKIDVTGLRALPLADYNRIRQGELVFAFGNPEGLRNSMTMGVVSSTARQLDPDSPNVFVQTDAPINPGNSGGPLVNADGELVGINTFIVSESGGSQGLGFAIPSVVIAAAYPQLRQYGHLRRGMVGLGVQAITPALAEGLQLPRTTGVLVSDVLPDTPAADAGVDVRDIITTLNGRPIDSVPALTLALNTFHAGESVTLGLIRGTQSLAVPIVVIERPDDIEQLSDLGDPNRDAVPRLGIVGVDLAAAPPALVSDLRISTGVLVAARREDADVDSPLMAGDVIHAVNSISVRSLDGLQVLADGFKSNTEVVLQIEREHRLTFVTVVSY